MEETQSNVAVCPHEDELVAIAIYRDGVTKDSFPDDFLVRLYRQCERDGILPWLFPGESASLVEFISRLAGKSLIVGFEKATYTMCGFGWIHDKQGVTGAVKASVSFAFFKKFWGSPEIRALARLTMNWWFHASEVDVLFGIQMRTNRLARRFALGLGFREVAVIPHFLSRDGKLEDATLVSLTKAEFLVETENGRRQHSAR